MKIVKAIKLPFQKTKEQLEEKAKEKLHHDALMAQYKYGKETRFGKRSITPNNNDGVIKNNNY